MTMEILTEAPPGDFKVHRTKIRASEVPNERILSELKKPVRYSALSNCQTGTLLFLTKCKTRAPEAELLIISLLVKANPLLALAMFHNLLCSLFEKNYFTLTTLGSPDNRTRLILKKAEAGIKLNSEEVAVLLLTKYSVEQPKKGSAIIKLQSSIKRAYELSKLGPWFKFQHQFGRFSHKLTKDEGKDLKKNIKETLDSYFSKVDPSELLTRTTGSVTLRPVVQFLKDDLTWLPLKNLVATIAGKLTPGKLLSDLESVESILRANFSSKSPSGYDLESYLDYSMSMSSGATSLDRIIGHALPKPSANDLEPSLKALIVSICLGANVIIYSPIDGDSQKGNQSRAEKVGTSTNFGLVFDTTIRVVSKGSQVAALSRKDVDFVSDFKESKVIASALETYVPVLSRNTFFERLMILIPQRMRDLFEGDLVFRKSAMNVISHIWVILTKWAENTAIVGLRIGFWIMNITSALGSMETDVGPRIKPSIPAINTPLAREEKFQAVEALGLSPLIQSPEWDVEDEEPDILVHPRLMTNGRSSWETEDIVDNHFRKCQAVLLPVASDWTFKENYRRKFNAEVHMDKYMTKRRSMAVDLMRAEIGVNNISYATSESTKISLERYSKTPPAHKVTNQDIKAYADI
jgi:hypothetical protein